jgi:preprotein translocase subunit Sss1
MSRRSVVRYLKADRILQTMENLADRIQARFPNSSLRNVAEELTVVVQESLETVNHIRQPNYWLRVGVVLLGLALAGLAGYIVVGFRLDTTHVLSVPEVVALVADTLTGIVFLLGLIGFLVSLELRFKRQRAVAALHELRAMAHIVDMHQLRKDPETFVGTHEGNDKRKMTPLEMARYLQYSTELLAIISKVAALYVEGLPDTQTLEAADRVENLTTGLSRKIWQKISLLDTIFQPHLAEFRAPQKPEPTPTPLSTGSPTPAPKES